MVICLMYLGKQGEFGSLYVEAHLLICRPESRECDCDNPTQAIITSCTSQMGSQPAHIYKQDNIRDHY